MDSGHVLQNRTHDPLGRLIVTTDVKEAPVIVAVHLDARGYVPEVNKIASVIVRQAGGAG